MFSFNQEAYFIPVHIPWLTILPSFLEGSPYRQNKRLESPLWFSVLKGTQTPHIIQKHTLEISTCVTYIATSFRRNIASIIAICCANCIVENGLHSCDVTDNRDYSLKDRRSAHSCYSGGMRWLQSNQEKTCHFRQLRVLLPCPSADWCHHRRW